MNTKKVKKAINKNVKIAQKKGGELEKKALKEFAKIKKEVNATSKKAEMYIKKNPAKAALISAGIGAALAGITALIATKKSTPVKKKKK